MDSQLYVKLTDAERKTQVACQQMLLLNDQLDSLKIRYDKAVQTNFRCFRYPLRMKIVAWNVSVALKRALVAAQRLVYCSM
jgi:hypothetical protein